MHVDRGMPPQMPIETNYEGYWGAPTATIDWCEANYEVSFYVAEFWNTLSNLVMIIPPVFGAIFAYKDKLESRYIWAYVFFFLVGIGSWSFHGTLLYEMQLLDELPMIWVSSFLIYMLVEVDANPNSSNLKLQLYLFSYCGLVTLIYIYIQKPIFHEVAYALMVVCILKYSIDLTRKVNYSKKLLLFSSIVYIVGFIIWNIDNNYCKNVSSIRNDLGYPVKPILQGHAWWHLFAGSGTYLFLLFATHARANFLKRHAMLKTTIFGLYPYMRIIEN